MQLYLLFPACAQFAKSKNFRTPMRNRTPCTIQTKETEFFAFPNWQVTLLLLTDWNLQLGLEPNIMS